MGHPLHSHYESNMDFIAPIEEDISTLKADTSSIPGLDGSTWAKPDQTCSPTGGGQPLQLSQAISLVDTQDLDTRKTRKTFLVQLIKPRTKPRRNRTFWGASDTGENTPKWHPRPLNCSEPRKTMILGPPPDYVGRVEVTLARLVQMELQITGVGTEQTTQHGEKL